jgi:hemerythrin superfamily protein
MSDTKIRTRKATQILKEDHQKVKGLFSDYAELGEGANAGKMHLFMELKRELTIHGQIEEELFYPAIQQLEEDDEETQDLVSDAVEAHSAIKGLLHELSSLTPEDEEFDAKIQVLKGRVLQHAEEEEQELFPCFDELEAEEQDDLSERLRQLKLDLTEEYE